MRLREQAEETISKLEEESFEMMSVKSKKNEENKSTSLIPCIQTKPTIPSFMAISPNLVSYIDIYIALQKLECL